MRSKIVSTLPGPAEEAANVSFTLTRARTRGVTATTRRPGRTSTWRALRALVAGITLIAAFLQGAVAAGPALAAPPSAGAGLSVSLTGSPGTPVDNPLTATLYVPIQCSTGTCATGVLDIVNEAGCNALVHFDCKVVSTADAGGNPHCRGRGRAHRHRVHSRRERPG